MKLIAYLTAVVVAAATLTTAAAAPSAGATVRGTTPAPARAAPAIAPQHREWSTAEELRDGRHGVAYFRGKTWSVQRRIPVPLTPTRYAERHTRSVAYVHWAKHLWHGRWLKAKHRLAAPLLPYTGDWVKAVRIVQRVWPGTASWLLSCSGGEGSHGGWVWNGGLPYSAGGPPTSYSGGYRTAPAGSSGAGGWMQFMLGTFAGSFRAALSDARQHHLAVPVRAAWSWVSPIGQAFAAGWARYHHATGAWDPGIDPACA